jgi:hypothetical protein
MKLAGLNSSKDEIIDWDNLIVSWKKDGTPNSRFTDNVWYVGDYAVSRSDPKVLNFERLIDSTSINSRTLWESKQVFLRCGVPPINMEILPRSLLPRHI